MKHSLVSWCCLLLLTLATRSCVGQADDYPVRPEYDLCNPKVPVNDPPRIYMEKPGVATEIFVKWVIEQNDTTELQCHMLFKSCPSCRIKVEAVGESFWNQPCVYDTDSSDIIPDCIPGCINMYLYDNFYKNVSVRASDSYSVIGYRSQSSQLNVVACAVRPFHRDQNISMRLRLTVIDKLQEINGDPYSGTPKRTFTSPNFPNPYVSNSEVYAFEFQSSSVTGFITVSFDDWVVSPTSEFLIEDANLVKVTGQNRRPYIISDGQSMRMSFNTGEFRIAGSYFTYLGFKAVATFYKVRGDIPDVQTDCGQMITDSGGFIMLSKVADGRIRDCIWVIKKTPEFEGVYLKLVRYRVGQALSFYENKLEIKDGLTSTTDSLLTVIPSVYGGSEGFDARSDVGFYIRLKGSYLMEDALVISYAMFISDCTNSIDYFKCGNGRCIPAFLKCDTYDHCGDKSDESTTLCSRVSESSRGSDYSISIGVIIPMVVSVFLVIVMCLLIIFIRRCRRLNNSTFGNRPNGVAQGRGRRRRRLNHNVQMSVTVSSGEHPPSYEEVIQNTPIGYLNMAFSWFQSDTTPTAPPSYEEAVMPPSATPSQNVEPAAAHGGSINNLLVQGAATLSSPQHQVSRATFMASLDPGAYVSSSSSSEYASEPENRLDLSSSSDTSTDENSSFITHRSNQDLSSRTSLDLNKDSTGNRFSVAQNAGKSVSKPGSVGGDMQVELDDISLSKHKTPANIGGPTERSRLDNDLRKNERNVREIGHRRRRDRTSSKEAESIKDPKRADKESDRLENGTRGSRDALNAPEHGNDGLYVKRNHKKPIKNGTEGPSHYSENASKITESSRSQSCFDLSLGGAVGGAVPSYSTGEARFEDKRFSYAGYGDVSLKREDLDPFCTGRGLVRDRPVENLNKYTAQSCDNLLQGYNIHANRDHRMVHENPQQSSSSCLDVSIKNRKTKQPHHTSSVSLSKFSDTGRSLHPVPEMGHPRSHAEPNRHIDFDKNSKPESHSAQVTTDLKPLQSVTKSTHDYKSSTAISRPVKHGQTSRGNIPNSKAADVLTWTPGPNLVLSDDAHRSTPDQEHQRGLSPNSDSGRTSHNSKDVGWLNSSEHKNSSDKADLPLPRDQYSVENPHSYRADAQLRDRQPQSPEPIYDIATPTDGKIRSHPKSVSPSDRRTYQKETNEPIYQRPNQSRENGRLNSGNSAPSNGNVRHNQGPEPIYKVPNNQSRDQPRTNQENNLTMGENVGHKQRPESIYQVPRQNQDPPRENSSSSQLRPSQSVGNVHQKPTPAPRQAKKSTSQAERERAPIPRLRSHHGTDRWVGHPDNSSSSVHPAQQSHHNQRPARATGDRLGNSARDLVEETDLRGRSDQVVLTLDPNIFQATENDVFV